MGPNLSRRATLLQFARFTALVQAGLLVGALLHYVVLGRFDAPARDSQNGEVAARTADNASLIRSVGLARVIEEGSSNPVDQFDLSEFQFPDALAVPDTQVDHVSDATLQMEPGALDEADALLFSGEFEAAAELLKGLHSVGDFSSDRRVLLRLAHCYEFLGQYADALSIFQHLSTADVQDDLSITSGLAVARIRLASGDRSAACHELMTLWLRTDRSLSLESRAQILHCLAAWSWPHSIDGNLLRDSVLHVPNLMPEQTELLCNLATLLAGRNASEGRTLPVVHSSVRSSLPLPGNVRTTHCARATPVDHILEEICRPLGWPVELVGNSSSRLSQTLADVDCAELPLDILLDLLLTPRGCAWQFDDGVLRIHESLTSNAASTAKQRRDSTSLELVHARIVEFAVAQSPDHPLTPRSHVLLALEAGRRQDWAAVERHCDAALQVRNGVRFRSLACLNQGKAMFVAGRRDDALRMFIRAVDEDSDQTSAAIACMYFARMLLEEDEPRLAIQSLRVQMPRLRGTAYEPVAVLLLTSACLLEGFPDDANDVLFSHRALFLNENSEVTEERKSFARQAALLSSLARFKACSGQQQTRERRALLESVSNLGTEDQFGLQWDYLKGVAFGLVGLLDAQESAFQVSLGSPSRFVLQHRMQGLLNGTRDLDSELSPPHRPTAANFDPAAFVISEREASSANLVTLVQARTALREREFQQVVDLCQSLLARIEIHSGASSSSNNRAVPGFHRADANEPLDPFGDENNALTEESQTHQRSALKLLGEAYQSMGRHDLAVRCLAGIYDERNAADHDTSAGEVPKP